MSNNYLLISFNKKEVSTTMNNYHITNEDFTFPTTSVDTNESSKVSGESEGSNFEELLKTHKTKSGLIRYLDSQGWKRSRIATFMNIRYQHVRNVLVEELKRA